MGRMFCQRKLKMIQHAPWKGRSNASGFKGQRIAIVGYSHYRSPRHADTYQFTKVVVERVLSGEQKGDSLFATVPGYFRIKYRADFWNRVLFFNFIPDCIGTSDNKFAGETLPGVPTPSTTTPFWHSGFATRCTQIRRT